MSQEVLSASDETGRVTSKLDMASTRVPFRGACVSQTSCKDKPFSLAYVLQRA